MVSAYTSSAFLKSCPVQRSIYTAIITQLFKWAVWNMKWNGRGMESSLICLVSARKELSVSPCLRCAGKINHNADKCTFLSNLQAYIAFVWFLVTGHSVRCNYIQQTFFLEINNFHNRGSNALRDKLLPFGLHLMLFTLHCSECVYIILQ